MVAVTVLVVTVFSAPNRISDQSIEGLFAMSDELFSSYQTLKRTFGGNEVILAVYQDDELFSESGETRQRLITEGLNRVDGIDGKSIGITSINDLIKAGNIDRFRSMIALAGLDVSTKLMLSKTKDLFSGLTHSKDERTAAIIILLKPKQETALPRGEIVTKLRRSLEKSRQALDFQNEIRLVGEPVMVTDGFRMVQADGKRLGWVATVTLMAVILIAFRSIRWALIPALIVQFSLWVNESLIATIGIQVTIVGSMSSAIITIIAVSTTIHLIIRIRQNLAKGLESSSAVTLAIGDLALPVTFACLTDAVGFAALWFAELEPVRDFATVMVFGSLLVLVAFWFLVPALSLTRIFESVPYWDLKRPNPESSSTFIDSLLLPLRIGKRFLRTLLGVMIAIMVFALLGIRMNTIESDFTRNFRKESDIAESYRFVEKKLGGAGVWDVLLPAPETLTIEYLQYVSNLQDRLRKEVLIESKNGDAPEKGLTKVLSLVDAVQAFSNTTLSKLGNAYLKFGMVAFDSAMPQFRNTLYGTDPQHPSRHYFRIMLRSHEQVTSDQKQSVIEQVNRICHQEFGNFANRKNLEKTGAKVQTTGFYVLLTFMIDSVIRDQWLTLCIAAAGIVSMLTLLFGNLRLAIIGLVPNLLPILVVLGTFGWIQLPMNLGIALIAAVAIGLSIDNSIHYIVAFQRQRTHSDATKSIRFVQKQVGPALVYATMALILGFFSLCFSDFLPTIYFGATAMIAMLGGLIGNLVLLPLLILHTDPENPQRQVVDSNDKDPEAGV